MTVYDDAQGDGPTWMTIPEAAAALNRPVTAVSQLLRRREILALREHGVARIPAEFVLDGDIVAGLPGTITLLSDAGLGDAEIIEWLFAPESTLGGSAMAALRRGSRKEVHRRAQVAGL